MAKRTRTTKVDVAVSITEPTSSKDKVKPSKSKTRKKHMASRNYMMPASDLSQGDIIEIPFPVVQVLEVKAVDGQWRNRKNRMLQFKVAPVDGPWSGTEGVFFTESADLYTVVEKHKPRWIRKLLTQVWQCINPWHAGNPIEVKQEILPPPPRARLSNGGY